MIVCPILRQSVLCQCDWSSVSRRAYVEPIVRCSYSLHGKRNAKVYLYAHNFIRLAFVFSMHVCIYRYLLDVTGYPRLVLPIRSQQHGVDAATF